MVAYNIPAIVGTNNAGTGSTKEDPSAAPTKIEYPTDAFHMVTQVRDSANKSSSTSGPTTKAYTHPFIVVGPLVEEFFCGFPK